ncbi:MAG: hypothetical protein IKU45_01780 [Clostridia bacterium]|nr:hypothetical protein [Clostridia bacterium]
MEKKNTKHKNIPKKEVVSPIDIPEKPLIPLDFVPDKINQHSLDKAYNLLKKYKSGKTNLERRITENDLWWKMRHWEQIRDRERKYYPASAWLFNAIANKHADVMDNCPEAIVLPREKSDSDAAKQLTDILPVILEQNSFEELYSDVWYDKLKGGTGVYGIFWDPSLNSGTGDIALKRCDVLNLFWEPGVSDIQSSPNLFHVELFNNDELEAKYPELHGKLGQNGFDVTKYRYDDAVDTSNKTPVVDWYYKTVYNGKSILHLCKFCADVILYSSENDITLYNRGYYDHGLYPFIFDKLYTEQGTPCGFGFIDVMKDTQTQIDLMSASVCENIRMASTVRYFARGDGSVNEREFADWSNPIVHYTGSGNPNDSMIPIRVPEMPSLYVSFINGKINELKETSGNSDFTRGNTASGVTAASAIAALQEAGSKLSRDMIKGSYNVFIKINNLIIELIRQFYDLPRCFRITGKNNEYEFVSYSNKTLLPQSMGSGFGFDLGNRLPIFDIKVKAQKQTAFSKLSQNELAKEFYGLGFFDPSRADSALACLDMMEFEGKNIIAEKINEKNTNANNYFEMYSKLLDMASIVEKEHPELNGIYNAFAAKYAPNSNESTLSSRPVTPSLKREVNTIKNARQRSTRASSPR